MCSTDDIQNVQSSWNEAYAEWDAKHGAAFYGRLFDKHPKIKEAFTNPDLAKQSALFGQMVASWVDNLGDGETLMSKVHGMCKTHKERGITDTKLFKDALDELVAFLTATSSLSEEKQASWNNVTAVIFDMIKQQF